MWKKIMYQLRNQIVYSLPVCTGTLDKLVQGSYFVPCYTHHNMQL